MKLVLCGLLVAFASQAYGLIGHNVTFQLAAVSLPTRDELTGPDSYVKLYEYTASDSVNGTEPELNRFGTSSRVMDEYNPKWPEVFWFWWQPGRKQKLRFKILDYDIMSYNDEIGSVDIDADTLMQNRNPEYKVNLTGDGGILVIKKTSPVVFKLHATSLPAKDRRWGYDGPSDPYVEIFYRNSREGEDIAITTSSTLTDEPNPVWPEVFEFSQYQPRTNQYLFFKIYDEDTFSGDDYIGEALIAVDELVKQKTPTTLSIGTKDGVGTLTVRLVGV